MSWANGARVVLRHSLLNCESFDRDVKKSFASIT